MREIENGAIVRDCESNLLAILHLKLVTALKLNL